MNMDFVVTTPGDDPAAVAGLTQALVASPASRWSGPKLRVFEVPAGLRPVYRPVELRPTDLSASPEPSTAALAADGRMDTSWATDRPQHAGDWLEARWPEVVTLGRVELSLASDPRREGRWLRVLASEDAQKWEELVAWPGRPHVEQQVASLGGFSQVLLLPATRARALRLELTRDGARRWAVSELHVFASTDYSWGPTELPHE
jgi:hypothetical protein